MIDVSDFVRLPYTPDLTAGGIAFALRSLPYSSQPAERSAYDRLRRVVAEAAVEIAFRRYLSDQTIPFDVKAALPFCGHDRYDVMLDGRRCEIKPLLIPQNQQISQTRQNPELLLKAPALVESDHHAEDGHSPRDLYIFTLLLSRFTDSRADLKQAIAVKQPHYFIHVMPESWNRPSRWNPLGTLVLKSESDEAQTIEIGGQDEGRTMRSCTVALPSRRRIEIPNRFFCLSYVHRKSAFLARIGVHSPVRRETHLIGAPDWSDIWVNASDILLAGYITREEFRRRASFIPAGSQVLPGKPTQVKNLAVTVSELRPLSALFERASSALP
jgi:hypothetical protein